MPILFLFAALLPIVSLEILSAKYSTHYLAAVVEYHPEGTHNPREEGGLAVVLNNVRHYEELIAKAKNQGVDIIVFPEIGLTGYGVNPKRTFFSAVPHPDELVSPCQQPSPENEPLRRLSCAAKSNGIYVAVNLYEKNGSKRYNTNVVFNRDGVVISRYRKMHLFNEYSIDVPDEKDYSVFHTDFGVTFGVFICFDIMFREPASELVHTQNVRHFVHSTAWYSEVMFLTAVQTQQAWSWSHNSVLLASGLNGPHLGHTGSGIYAGRKGLIKAIFTGEETTRLLIARVPKDLDAEDDSCSLQCQPEVDKEDFESIIKNLSLLKDWMHAFATQLLPLEGVEDDIKLCHDKFCCHFEMRKEPANPTAAATNDAALSETQMQHRLFVWNGVRDYAGAATGGVQLCGVVACKNASDVMSCGMPIPTHQYRKVKFSKLQIRGSFESNNKMLLADTLNRYMLPLPAQSYDLTEAGVDCGKTEHETCVTMNLLRAHTDIQTFAIYNRVFSQDGSNYTHTKP